MKVLIHTPKRMGKVTGKVEEEEGEAIEALGSLFKLTQIHLWVDTDTHLVPLSHEHSRVDDTSGIANIRSDEMGLMKEMNDLGLPVSFRASKEWKNRTRGYQKKGIKDRLDDEVNVILKEEEDKDLAVNVVLVSDLKTPEEEVDIPSLEDDCVQITVVEEENHEVVVESCFLGNGDGDSVLASETRESHDSNEWKVYWDSFYGRSYFYNVKTQESTWEPPLGMEHLAYSDESHNLNELVIETTEKHHDDLCGTGPGDNVPVEIADDIPAEKADDLVGVCRSQFETEATEEVNSSIDTYQESTWEPPLGMEHLAYSDESHNLNELVIETTEKHHDDLCGTGRGDDVPVERADDVPAEKADVLVGVCQSQFETEATEEVNSSIDTYQETSVGNQSLDITTLDEEGNSAYVVSSVRKAKKESRRSRAKKNLLNSYTGTGMKGVLEEYSAILGKYWCQRYLLFSRFDEGIKMDEEGWFSVTPEPIAKHHATRCNEGIVIDCFTGVGGNAIQFASRSHYVIAIDLDPKKLDLAQHNAAIYGVADKIDFVKGDFFDLAHNLKAGTVFLSPPWGGPDYLKVSTYDMKTMLRPRDGEALFKAAMNIASTIIMFLPRNVDINQLAELALLTSPPWSLEVEKNYLNGKLKAITAYYVRQNSC